MWRYSRIAELDLDAFVPAPESGSRVVAPDGVAVLRVDDVGESSIETLPGSVVGPAVDAFDELHAAFATPVVIDIPAGVRVSEPVYIVHEVPVGGVATFPHTVVRVGAGASVTVIEQLVSAEGVSALVVPLVEVEVGRGAEVELVSVQELGRATWQLGRQASRVADGGRFRSLSVALGGDYARSVISSTLSGPRAHGEMLAAYFGEGHQTLDFRTRQDHAAPKTTSELLFKGAVQGHAQSVYTGTIHIAKHAKGCDAFQTNRNIKLSEHAWAESVPNLDIENNDVRCSHASAVGPVDPEQRFYLESRGVPPEVGERLIVAGFLDEVLDRCSVPSVVGPVRAAVTAKLDRRNDDDQ